MRIPAEAGKLVVAVRGKRSGPILGGTMLVMLAAMPLFDRKLWPVSLAIVGMAVVIGGAAFLVKRLFIRKLIAVGERGLVVQHRGEVIVVPWSAITSVTRQRGGRGMETISLAMSAHYVVAWNDGSVGFVPHDMRGDTGEKIVSALRMFGKQQIPA